MLDDLIIVRVCISPFEIDLSNAYKAGGYSNNYNLTPFVETFNTATATAPAAAAITTAADAKFFNRIILFSVEMKLVQIPVPSYLFCAYFCFAAMFVF